MAGIGIEESLRSMTGGVVLLLLSMVLNALSFWNTFVRWQPWVFVGLSFSLATLLFIALAFDHSGFGFIIGFFLVGNFIFFLMGLLKAKIHKSNHT